MVLCLMYLFKHAVQNLLELQYDMFNIPPERLGFFFRDEAVEAEVRFMQKVAAEVRSTRADYNLASKTRTDLYLRVFCTETAAMLGRYTATIATLATCQRVLVTEEPPLGCAIITVSDKVYAS